MLSLRKKQKPIFHKGKEGSLLTQFKENFKYLISPVYLAIITTFIMGNFNMTLSLNVLRQDFQILLSQKSRSEQFQSERSRSEGLGPKNRLKRSYLSVSWRQSRNIQWSTRKGGNGSSHSCYFNLSGDWPDLWFHYEILEKLWKWITRSPIPSPCFDHFCHSFNQSCLVPFWHKYLANTHFYRTQNGFNLYFRVSTSRIILTFGVVASVLSDVQKYGFGIKFSNQLPWNNVCSYWSFQDCIKYKVHSRSMEFDYYDKPYLRRLYLNA